MHTVDEHSAAERKEIWGVVLNPIAPLTLPKPQEFAYQITNVPYAAATEADAGNPSASDAAAGPA